MLGYKRDGLNLRLGETDSRGLHLELREKEETVQRLHSACADLRTQFQDVSAELHRRVDELRIRLGERGNDLDDKQRTIDALHAQIARLRNKGLTGLMRRVARRVLRRTAA